MPISFMIIAPVLCVAVLACVILKARSNDRRASKMARMDGDSHPREFRITS
jgi:hypothetical protein